MILPARRLALALALCLLVVALAFPQDEASGASSVDELFKAPQGDTEVQSTDARELLNPFHAQPLSVTGSFSSMVGIVGGFTDGQDEDGDPNGSYDLGVTPGLNFVPVLSFGARPDETIRFQGTVSFPFESSEMFAPAINEIFFDYTLQDRIYIRIGRHLVSWGVTRIFGAGGDLMAGSSEGLDIKVTVPIASGGLTAVTLMPSSFMTDNYSWRELTTGLQFAYPFGRSEFIFSGTYFGNDAEYTPLRATAIVKTSCFGVDLFAESIYASSVSQRPDFSISPVLNGIVSGFFWEQSKLGLKLYGEYYVDATDRSYKSQFVSAAAGLDRVLGSPFNLAMQWSHAFLDGSGIIVPGVSARIMPHISMQLGLPVRYGEAGSFYLVNQSPSVQTAVVPTKALKWNQRYGLLLRVTMSTDF